MANRTDPLAASLHGTNPQFLVSKIVRQKIHNNSYWKEECFGLTAETIIDKAIELKYVGGTYGGNRKPTPFLCLVQKLLQIQPSKEIIVEYIRQDDNKYLRALGGYYLRLTGSPIDIYSYLEPLLIDYRKLRYLQPDGKCSLSRMDEFIDECLRRESLLDVDMPGLLARNVLEEQKLIEQRVSVLEDDLEFEDEELLLADAPTAALDPPPVENRRRHRSLSPTPEPPLPSRRRSPRDVPRGRRRSRSHDGRRSRSPSPRLAPRNSRRYSPLPILRRHRRRSSRSPSPRGGRHYNRHSRSPSRHRRRRSQGRDSPPRRERRRSPRHSRRSLSRDPAPRRREKQSHRDTRYSRSPSPRYHRR